MTSAQPGSEKLQQETDTTGQDGASQSPSKAVSPSSHQLLRATTPPTSEELSLEALLEGILQKKVGPYPSLRLEAWVGLEICISNKFPGASSLGTTL